MKQNQTATSLEKADRTEPRTLRKKENPEFKGVNVKLLSYTADVAGCGCSRITAERPRKTETLQCMQLRLVAGPDDVSGQVMRRCPRAYSYLERSGTKDAMN